MGSKKNIFNVNTAVISTDELNRTVKKAKINANGYPRLIVNGKSKCLSNKSFGIGRDKSNSLIVADPKVSKFHAIISFAKGIGYIRDSFSLNGTYLNGKRLPPGKNIRLKNGDKIKVGSTRIVYQR
jgi:pSer/pThr/pTyr-binding forkhead associated (FHA) protein